MGIVERRSRDRSERERRITAAARGIAEEKGWGAVTIRRLADAIEYSQPVLYSHFPSRNAIIAAVAVEGFIDLAQALRKAARGTTDRQRALEKVAEAYLTFARQNPSLYEAMFTLPGGLRFAQPDTKPELKDAFAALAEVAASPHRDRELATETFWAVLHGLVELERSGRIRPGARSERVALVVNVFGSY